MRKELTVNVNTPTNDAASYKIAYVSTTATQTQLYNLAAAINSLTNNTLVSVDLTTVEELQGE